MIKKEKIIGIFGAMIVALGSLSADDIKPNGCKGPSLCTDLPLEESCGFYFNVGLIYEQMRISNTMVAYEQIEGPSPGTAASPNRSNTMLNLAFGMEPGFRFGVGYEHGHDDWQVNASFEWLRSQGGLSKEMVTDQIYYIPTYTNEYASYYSVDATLDVDYFLVEAYLSRGSYISNKYSLEPIAGFQATWIYYDTNTSFAGQSASPPHTQLYVTKVDFWGVGPMVGVNGNYHMCAGWSVFALSNFAILLGESALNYYEGRVIIETLPGANKVMTTLVVASPTMRAVVGIQYERYVMCESQHLTLRAGFDGRYYFNQYPVTLMNNEIGTTNNGPLINENGSFAMVGLLLDLGWSF